MSVIIDSLRTIFSKQPDVHTSAMETRGRKRANTGEACELSVKRVKESSTNVKILEQNECVNKKTSRGNSRVTSESSIDSGFVSPTYSSVEAKSSRKGVRVRSHYFLRPRPGRTVSGESIDMISCGGEKIEEVKDGLVCQKVRRKLGEEAKKNKEIDRNAQITGLKEKERVESGAVTPATMTSLASDGMCRKTIEELLLCDESVVGTLFKAPTQLKCAKGCVVDLWEDMEETHRAYEPVPYLDDYVNIDANYRSSLLLYLEDMICRPNNICPSTFHLAINYIDRFMDLSRTKHNENGSRTKNFYKRFLLIGVTALFTACKFEEVNPPSLTYYTNCADFFKFHPEYASLCGFKPRVQSVKKLSARSSKKKAAEETMDKDYYYSRKAIYTMEKHMLAVFGWKLRPVTAVGWLEVYLSNTNSLNFSHNVKDSWNDLDRDDNAVLRTLPRKGSISLDSGYNTSDGEEENTSLKMNIQEEDCSVTGDSQLCYCRELEKLYRPCFKLLTKLAISDMDSFQRHNYSVVAASALYAYVVKSKFDPFVNICSGKPGFETSLAPQTCVWIEHVSGYNLADLEGCVQWILSVVREDYFVSE